MIFLASQPVFAAGRIALVIGNGNYDASKPINERPNLRNTRSDAQLVSATFKKLGFKVILLEDATKAVTEQALNALKTQGNEAPLGVVYYSGHGMEVDGTNYLCPIGGQLATRQDPDRYHVRLDTVLAKMAEAKIEAKVVILDCCRNDPFQAAPRTMEVEGQPAQRTNGLAVVDRIPQSTLIMYAAGPGQTASDGRGVNSPFTEIFSSVIQTPGISCFEAFFQVSDHVKKQTNSAQQPWVKFDGAADAFRKYTFGGAAPATGDANAGVVMPSQQDLQTMQEEINKIHQESEAAMANGATAVPQNTPQALTGMEQANTEVSVFLRRWISNQESNSAQAWAADFAPMPKYCYWKGFGGAPASFLLQDRQELIEKYPSRDYEVLGNATCQYFNNFREAIVVVSYHYEYSGVRRAGGNSINTIGLSKQGANWVITSYQEEVRRNALTPSTGPVAVTAIDQASADAFLARWISNNRSNRADDWVADFAPSVSYCYKKDGPADAAYLRQDRQELIDKFANRNYRILRFNVDVTDPTHATATLDYSYDYGRPKGKSTLKLSLALRNGRIEITRFDEKVLR
ncbi:MAG: caspase family protein [Luteolibacter sp.]